MGFSNNARELQEEARRHDVESTLARGVANLEGSLGDKSPGGGVM